MIKIPLIDTHTHLCDPVYDIDRHEVINRAIESGVRSIIAVGETLSDGLKNLELSREYPEIKPGIGLFPTHLDFNQAKAVMALIQENREDCFCIGEVGLDYWKVKHEEERENQREIFRQFIGLASRLDLPLNVHSRSSGKYAIKLLLETNAKKVQMHAFDGKSSTALPGVEAGYYFSIPTSLVRSPQKQKLIKKLPLSCLLVETDSPVLGPIQGTRNEPANITMVIKNIAEIKQISEEKVMETVLENTKRLYGERIL